MSRRRNKPESVPGGGRTADSPGVAGISSLLPSAALELLNDGLRAGILTLDGDGSIRCANLHARKLLGIPETGEISGGLREGNKVAGMINRRIAGAPDAGGGIQRHFFQMDLQGSRFLSVTLFPLTSEEQRGDWVVMMEDSSEIIRKGREASNWNRHLVHDLRSPLSSVTGAVDLIFSGRLGSVDEKILRFLKILRKGADRMVEMLAEASENRPPGTPPTEKVEEGTDHEDFF